MVREGVLSPAKSGELITKQSSHVHIHERGLEKLSAEMLSSMKDKKLEIPDTGANIRQPSKDDPRAVDWLFMVDALNFCFWSYPGHKNWKVDGYTGYYALEAAMSRALQEDGFDITNPQFYSKITEEQFFNIMKGDNKDIKPHEFHTRLAILHEVGSILVRKYDGTFMNCLKKADKSAMKLLELVVTEFPSFRDEALYKGHKVSLHKRAQILVADIWNFYNGKGLGEFYDIEKITMFADYRVPQVLLYFGVLSYSDSLLAMLNSKKGSLPKDSDEEIEIRGCSIHAVELLKKMIQEKVSASQLDVEVPNSIAIDYYLWCYRRKYASEMEKIPYHRTITTFY